MAVDCANAYVGNNIVQIDTENSDVTPIIVDDRTLVPVDYSLKTWVWTLDIMTRQGLFTLSGNGL